MITAQEWGQIEAAIELVAEISMIFGIVIGLFIGCHVPALASWIESQYDWWRAGRVGRRRGPR